MLITLLDNPFCSDALIVHNDGPRIAHSNYWSSALAAAKMLFVSFNAGACHLLIPDGFDPELVNAASTSREVLVTRTPELPKHAGRYAGIFALELLWEDDTATPYSLCVSAGQVDRLPAVSHAGCALPVSLWSRCSGGQPEQLSAHAGWFRVAPQLPYLRPWSD